MRYITGTSIKGSLIKKHFGSKQIFYQVLLCAGRVGKGAVAVKKGLPLAHDTSRLYLKALTVPKIAVSFSQMIPNYNHQSIESSNVLFLMSTNENIFIAPNHASFAGAMAKDEW